MKDFYLGYGCLRATKLGNDLVLNCWDGYNPVSCELVRGKPLKKINSEILDDGESYDMLIKPNTSFLVYVSNQYDVLFHYNGKDVLDIASTYFGANYFQIDFELCKNNSNRKYGVYRYFDKSFSKVKTIEDWNEKIKNYNFKDSKKLNENIKIYNFNQFLTK